CSTAAAWNDDQMRGSGRTIPRGRGKAPLTRRAGSPRLQVLRARKKAVPPSGKITISVASRVAHVDMIHAISDQVAALVGFGEDDILNLGLAVREAAINAIKHGNRLNPRKRVRVVFEFNGHGLSVAN